MIKALVDESLALIALGLFAAMLLTWAAVLS